MNKKKQPVDNFQAFRLLLLGRSNVGKTKNGLDWALTLIKQGMFKPKNVFIISFTWKTDPSQNDLIQYCQSKYKDFQKNNCKEDVDLDFIKNLFERQKAIKEQLMYQPPIEEIKEVSYFNPRNGRQIVKPMTIEPQQKVELENVLIIFDDQISSNLIKRQDKDPTLKKMFCIGRHYNISQIWMLQRFKSTIDPTCRDQFTKIAIFKQGNKKALIELLQDYDENPDPDYKNSVKQMYQWYLDSVESNDGHGCFVINVLVSFGKGRLQQNLTGEIYYDM